MDIMDAVKEVLSSGLLRQRGFRHRLVTILPAGSLDYDLWRLPYLLHQMHNTRPEALALFDQPVEAVTPEFGRVSSRVAVFCDFEGELPLNGQKRIVPLDGSIVLIEDGGGCEFVMIAQRPLPRIV